VNTVVIIITKKDPRNNKKLNYSRVNAQCGCRSLQPNKCSVQPISIKFAYALLTRWWWLYRI